MGKSIKDMSDSSPASASPAQRVSGDAPEVKLGENGDKIINYHTLNWWYVSRHHQPQVT